MATANAAAEAPPIFSAILTPHRSLTARGFALIIGAAAVLSVAVGTTFWALGAWPVPGFMGLDVLALYVAFRLNYRAARATEEISVTRERLTVRRTDASGRSSVTDLNPYWARLEIDRAPESGITRMWLASHGRRLPIGAFLGPDERETLATALNAALAKARHSALP